MRNTLAILLALLLCGLATAQASPDVMVEGLLPEAAVLKVDGQRKMVRVGQSFNGVKLLASGATSATLEVGGQRLVVGLSQQVGTAYAAPKVQSVVIPRDQMMQYITTAEINGRQTRVLVDTGASSVAMSEVTADALGIDYYNGIPVRTVTASGEASARLVTLQTISVGGIQVNGVQAAVVEGSYPQMVLLGMTFLQHVKMQDANGVLTLSRAK